MNNRLYLMRIFGPVFKAGTVGWFEATFRKPPGLDVDPVFLHPAVFPARLPEHHHLLANVSVRATDNFLNTGQGNIFLGTNLGGIKRNMCLANDLHGVVDQVHGQAYALMGAASE